MKRRVSLVLAFVTGVILAWVALVMWANERDARFRASSGAPVRVDWE